MHAAHRFSCLRGLLSRAFPLVRHLRTCRLRPPWRYAVKRLFVEILWVTLSRSKLSRWASPPLPALLAVRTVATPYFWHVITPSAPRHALSSTPPAQVVPCHRVVGADGSLTGHSAPHCTAVPSHNRTGFTVSQLDACSASFNCGVDVKRWLLDFERKDCCKSGKR